MRRILSFYHAEHRMLAAQLAKCRFCFENPDIAKHLIIAIGLKVKWVGFFVCYSFFSQ